ncbi:putative membrane protein YphA (DoxX/SURF4 family) [Motilibacter rhizosphaerae]|uniref:Putative membrane protein YphA (DoxX/SURF4 family) n=1 Tax=Motilibacter rhizosphaerae TaxID=598652 RepID=A0A4Q7NPD4_9ACTN|nr:DoxX family protein [Motilibacter rhizosphaerae]RZS87145.1 putative membrane protein YphA (DoxX/SURF4 family) [Motilibacter rhizosphaerae]
MPLVRRLARPMLAATFVSGGIAQLKDPESKAEAAEPVATPVARKVSWLPEDATQLVRINGAVQVGAGALLALGRLPRVSALLLAGSIVPTTLAGHRFWEQTDAASAAQQRTQFLKNLGLLGGLLLAAVDTGGNPSIAWRTRHAATSAKRVAAAAPTRALKAVA